MKRNPLVFQGISVHKSPRGFRYTNPQKIGVLNQKKKYAHKFPLPGGNFKIFRERNSREILKFPTYVGIYRHIPEKNTILKFCDIFFLGSKQQILGDLCNEIL